MKRLAIYCGSASPADPRYVSVAELMEVCDGFVLTGGRPNVHPEEYGEKPTEAHGAFDRARDAITLPLVRACLERGQPFLGICRGFQEVNVAMGGTLHPEIRDLPGRDNHRMPPDGTLEECFALRHTVSLTPGGVFHRLFGASEVLTNTLHGQGVVRPGQGVVMLVMGDTELTNNVPQDEAFINFPPLDGVINTGGARIRSGAGLNFNVTSIADFGAGVPVDARNEAGDWLRVVYNDSAGWIYYNLVDVPAAEIQNLPVVDDTVRLRVPRGDELARALEAEPEALMDAEVTLPRVDGAPCFAYELPEDAEAPPGYALVGLRGLHAHVSPELFTAVGAAYQKVFWLRTHGFCSRCGSATRRHDRHQALECSACGHLHFPRLAPAVIVLVERGREMLLGRSPHFPEGMFSTLAGFVEPGESLEDTIHREILEEVGVEVRNLRYFGSQPWPFPHSLMVGFVAEWASGEIRPDGEEVTEARWFTPDELPPRLPGELSIARRLVDDFLKRVEQGSGP